MRSRSMLRPVTNLTAVLVLLIQAAACVAQASVNAPAQGPAGLLLTWQRDPLTTMTIDWHTVAESGGDKAADTATAPSVVHYREAGTQEWQRVEGSRFPFPHVEGRTIHRVELTDLKPDTSYEFRVGDFERKYSFRTMPTDLTRPLVFATGGDTRHNKENLVRTNRVAMKYNPAFILWGGDLAYADGNPKNVDRWIEWFDGVTETLVAEDGRVVPVVVGIGNHEVQKHFHYNHNNYEQTDAWRARVAPFFYQLFAFPGQPGYGVLDFSDYLSIVLLDSDHTNPVAGEQTRWLERVLAERRGVQHVIPVYHVPGYPSHRDANERTPVAVRQYWLPLFEQAGNIRIVFENHDHAYKRTVPIRAGKADARGIVYLGDGAWGVGTRKVHDVKSTWYLARAESVRHAMIVTLHGSHQHVLAVSEKGEVLDEYPATPHRR